MCLRLLGIACGCACGDLGRLRWTRLRFILGRALGFASSASFRLRLAVGLYLGRAFHIACLSSASKRVRFHSVSSDSSESSSVRALTFLFLP